MSTEQVQELEAKVKKYKADAEDREDAFKKLAQERTDLEAQNKSYAESVEKARLKGEEDEIDCFIDKIEGITPAMKPFAKALLHKDLKEYSIEKKQYSKNEVLAEILKLHSASSEVNLEEGSTEGEKGKKEDVDLAKIEKYAQENKVSFSKAYKAVLRTGE